MKSMFMTGATGFVGGEALQRYVNVAPDLTYILMVRARDEEHLATRAEKLLETLFADRKEELRSRFTFVRGDLLKEGLDISEDDLAKIVAEADHVLHCAASVDFAMALAESRKFNLDGTRRVIEICEKMQREGSLRRLDYVSATQVRKPGVDT